jgi:Uma2 family endonuclease
MMHNTTELKTAADYMAMPWEGKRYELIAGELLLLPTPPIIHQEVLVCLVGRSSALDRRHGKFCMMVSCFITEHEVYQPDLLFLPKDNLSLIEKDGVHGAPDFVIEILDPATAYYDLKHKKDIYEKIGVREYWIVDPMDRSIECFVNSGNGYETVFLGKQTGRACSVVIPEFCVEVEEVFSL